jgi:hypothetical protein
MAYLAINVRSSLWDLGVASTSKPSFEKDSYMRGTKISGTLLDIRVIF